VKLAKSSNASGIGADGATATTISANPAPMRRSKPRDGVADGAPAVAEGAPA